MHGEHGSRLNLLTKLFVEHTDSLLSILVAHTDGGGVFRRGLRHHEHADAVVGKCREDALVDADDTHHGQTCYSDERRALDA